jgi:hypothetical protein
MDIFSDDSICIYNFKLIKKKKFKNKNKKLFIYKCNSKNNYFYNDNISYSDHPTMPTPRQQIN